MRILVINSGSSSIKYALFDSEKNYHKIAQGKLERIGEGASDYRSALEKILGNLNKSEIEAVGHRVVHGGEALRDPTLITDVVIAQIREVGRFVPLHCTPNLLGITLTQEMLPSIPHVAVFDTAAYESLEAKAYLYGIPLEYYEKHQIRKYGFHGINHHYVAKEAAKLLKREKLKVISCHLGSGCSISAFENGKSVDTSMGLTPLEGLIMATRSGDIDPSVVLYLIEALGSNTDEITDLLNKKSGLLGLSGKEDMRDIAALAQKGERRAQLAIEMFVYRIQKYIGAYIAVLQGVDALIFTGGIGENDASIRERIATHFAYLGAAIDQEKNQRHAPLFSASDSKLSLLTIAAGEELAIAQQSHHLLN
jgi:acetate kinase